MYDFEIDRMSQNCANRCYTGDNDTGDRDDRIIYLVIIVAVLIPRE